MPEKQSMEINEYEVKFLTSFNDDLEQIVYYISHILKNSEAANRLVDNIENAIYERLKNPLSFQPYHPKIKLKNTYYRIYVGNYTVFYIVKDNVMEVHRLLYSPSNINNYLE